MTDHKNLAAEGPYDSHKRRLSEDRIDAAVRVQDALDHLSEEEIAAMADEEIEEAVLEWIDSGAAGQRLPDIPWTITDNRFSHSRAVVDVVVDEVALETVDDGTIELRVELHETAEGFQQRLEAEAVAGDLDDLAETLRADQS